MNPDEFRVFEQTLKVKLPVSFRINSGEVNHQKFSEMLRASDFIQKYTSDDFEVEPDEHGSYKTAKVDFSQLCMDCKPYYPG